MIEPKITPIQQDIIDFIVKYYRKTKFYPNYEEICEGVGKKSKSTICEHMMRLSEQGIIIFKANKGKRGYSAQWRLANIDLLLKGLE